MYVPLTQGFSCIIIPVADECPLDVMFLWLYLSETVYAWVQ